MSAAYQIRQCNEYGKLGMMGVTILFSSGDNGVAGFAGCIDPATGERACTNATLPAILRLLDQGQESVNGTRFDPGLFHANDAYFLPLISHARLPCELPIRYCW